LLFGRFFFLGEECGGGSDSAEEEDIGSSSCVLLTTKDVGANDGPATLLYLEIEFVPLWSDLLNGARPEEEAEENVAASTKNI
jgi:hypothetical protein